MAWTKAKTAIATAAVFLLVGSATTTLVLQPFRPKAQPTIVEETNFPLRFQPIAITPGTDHDTQLRRRRGGTLTLEAFGFVKALKVQGRLPGFSPDDSSKGNIMSANFIEINPGVWHWSNEDSEAYPVTRTITARRENLGDFDHFYTVVKSSPTESWRVQKAWRMTNGKIAEEFPVP